MYSHKYIGKNPSRRHVVQRVVLLRHFVRNRHVGGCYFKLSLNTRIFMYINILHFYIRRSISICKNQCTRNSNLIFHAVVSRNRLTLILNTEDALIIRKYIDFDSVFGVKVEDTLIELYGTRKILYSKKKDFFPSKR